MESEPTIRFHLASGARFDALIGDADFSRDESMNAAAGLIMTGETIYDLSGRAWQIVPGQVVALSSAGERT